MTTASVMKELTDMIFSICIKVIVEVKYLQVLFSNKMKIKSLKKMIYVLDLPFQFSLRNSSN